MELPLPVANPPESSAECLARIHSDPMFRAQLESALAYMANEGFNSLTFKEE